MKMVLMNDLYCQLCITISSMVMRIYEVYASEFLENSEEILLQEKTDIRQIPIFNYTQYSVIPMCNSSYTEPVTCILVSYCEDRDKTMLTARFHT